MPSTRFSTLRLMRRSNSLPKRYTTQQITEATQRRIRDVLAATAGFTGSALGGLLRQTGSLAVGVYEEVE
ncbi:hypothetical protein ACKC9G_13850 [Pokkaliibacter sp. CJK22405]|uniref:hypothetical protein n=1 Tax=Pokkaliibacter sp. CJK22405 TaxID=3384615 RepID=UPI003984E2DD